MDVTMALPISFFLVLRKGWWEWQCLGCFQESNGGLHRPHPRFGQLSVEWVMGMAMTPLPILGRVALASPPRCQDKKQDSIGEEKVGNAIMPTIPPLA